jgi:stearoyl-CoA desaturase (delta-9 desaturase)
MFVVAHLGPFAVLLVHFSWRVVAIAIASYLVRMWGLTAGYHRYFSQFKTGRVFQFVLAWLGASAFQNGPLWWASWHRAHHRHSDIDGDAHSPVLRGFWYAQLGWYYSGKHMRADTRNVADLARYPELCFIERFAWLPPLTFAFACFAAGGWAGLAWGFGLSTILVLHCVGLINSLGHLRGSRPYETGDGSRNNALLAAITLGDGWHNNHHHCMASARHGFRWWQLDPTYWSLRLLESFGVVRDLRMPTPKQLLREHQPLVG